MHHAYNARSEQLQAARTEIGIPRIVTAIFQKQVVGTGNMNRTIVSTTFMAFINAVVYLLTGYRIYGVVRRLKRVVHLRIPRLVSAVPCNQIQENLHELIEQLPIIEVTPFNFNGKIIFHILKRST